MKILVALVAIVALSGCGSSGSSSAAAPKAAATSPSTSPAQARLDYMDALQQKYPADFNTVDAPHMVSLGKSVCAAWGRDVEFTQMVTVGVGTYTVAETEYLVRQATHYLCPKYEDRLP